MNFVENSHDYVDSVKIRKKWTLLLLNWLNKCIHPKHIVDELNFKSLHQVMVKYKDEMHLDIIDEALLCSEDMESFIKYKYPALKTCYLGGKSEEPQMLFTMTSILLYYCCVNASEGRVDSDICEHLKKPEQEMILKFCENLTNVDITSTNVFAAITDAYLTIKESLHNTRKARHQHRSYIPDPSTDGQGLSGLRRQPFTVLRTVVGDTSTSNPSESTSGSCDDESCCLRSVVDSSDNEHVKKPLEPQRKVEKTQSKTKLSPSSRSAERTAPIPPSSRKAEKSVSKAKVSHSPRKAEKSPSKGKIPQRRYKDEKSPSKGKLPQSHSKREKVPSELEGTMSSQKIVHRCMNCGHRCPENMRCTKCSYRCQQKCCTPMPRKVRKCCRCINWKIYMLLALVMIVLVLTGVVVSILSSSSSYTPLKLDIENLQFNDDNGSDVPGLQRELDMNEDDNK